MARRPNKDENDPGEQPREGVELRKFSGLKNTVSATRLGADELEYAINVDIDDVGEIRRRRGQTQKISGNISSIYNTLEGLMLGVVNGVMSIINPDFSTTALQDGHTNFPISYVQVGKQVYYSSLTNSGIVDTEKLSWEPWEGPSLGPPTIGVGPDTIDGTPVPTPQVVIPSLGYPNFWYSPVVNPTATLPPIRGRILGPPPQATFLAYFNGRIYLAQGRQVWATELYLYKYVDRTKNYWTFEANVTGIAAVTDGIYVGTEEGVWFVSGSYAEAKRVRVMDTGCIPGSMLEIPGELANPPQVGLNEDTPVKVSIGFMTQAGYCGGQDGGLCYNYTETKYIFPGITSAAALFRRQDGVNQYIATANSDGTPTANARIGDHLDATLIRGGAWNSIRDSVRIAEGFTAGIITAGGELWILEGGVWNDVGLWIDNQNWND